MSEDGRVFLRGMDSPTYGLKHYRDRQRSQDRVRKAGTVVDDASVGHSGDEDSKQSRTYWMLGPGDERFLTQTLQVHFVELMPGGTNYGHGHQNEAHFYILEGKGYEIHDGQRYEWEKDDLVIVHTDSKHKHHNLSATERALALVMKAKTSWMVLGLLQQGRSGTLESEERYGPREDWSQLWTPGWQKQKKVIKPSDTRWETTRDGRVRTILSTQRIDARTHSLDLYQQEVPGGSRSGKHWHMADEAIYVISGRGYSLQWDVEAEIDDKYYARIAKEPSRWEFAAGDLLYVPQNTVHQTFNADAKEPLVFLSAQNRLFKHLGYDNVVHFEDAPEHAGREREAVGAPGR
ncbi:MAG TPA: cupin domain-containing protein [Candidatus Limnocylindria bacterium]|nr:cupin domain-containing protein [Candidatus Limnocylindria bacterium]